MMVISAQATVLEGFIYATNITDSNTGHIYRLIKKTNENNEDLFYISRSNRDGVFINYRPLKGLKSPKFYKISANNITFTDKGLERVFDLNSGKSVNSKDTSKLITWSKIN
jgi:hypothetical protein